MLKLVQVIENIISKGNNYKSNKRSSSQFIDTTEKKKHKILIAVKRDSIVWDLKRFLYAHFHLGDKEDKAKMFFQSQLKWFLLSHTETQNRAAILKLDDPIPTIASKRMCTKE